MRESELMATLSEKDRQDYVNAVALSFKEDLAKSATFKRTYIVKRDAKQGEKTNG